VTYQGKTITATITDECATCDNDNGHIDLSLAAAQALGIAVGGGSGDPTNITWEAVSCPVTGNIYAFYNNGSPTGGVYFQNTRYAVSAVAGHTQSNGMWNANGGQTVMLTGGGQTISCVLPGSSGPISNCQFPAPTTCTAP